MSLHDVLTNGESESRVLPGEFGAHKGIENARPELFGDSAPVVGDPNLETTFLRQGLELDVDAPLLQNCLDAVLQEVNEYLL